MKATLISLKSPVVVVGGSFHQIHLGSRDAAYRPVPVVSYPHIKVSGVKVLKILVERYKILHMDEKVDNKAAQHIGNFSYITGISCNDI